jgi:predicted RNase H-like nuclease (RuvC/YqgF family)
MLNMYQTKKKKREVDPDAPPRPTLLGHEKEMKTWREQFEKLAHTNTEQAITIAAMERKLNRLQSQVDAMTSFINRINK